MSERPATFKVKMHLRHDGKDFQFDWDSYYPTEDAARFDIEENNYSCDCNRSLLIQQELDSSFPQMECGDTVELVDYQLEPVA
jgi:hypothetical protein